MRRGKRRQRGGRPWRILLILFVALAVPGSTPRAAAQAGPCQEPNTGYASACKIDLDVTVRGTIAGPADQDVYKFDLPAEQFARVRIELTDLPADYDLHLFNGLGGLLASSTNEGAAPDVIDLVMPHQRGYVFVHPGRGEFDPTAPYSLTVSASPLKLPTPAEAADACPAPNNGLADACALVPGQLAFGRLDGPGDLDTYRIDVPEAGSLVTIELRAGVENDRFWYERLEADGRVLGRSRVVADDYRRLGPGTLFLRVGRDGGGAAAYGLLVAVTSPVQAPEAGPDGDCPEPNEARSNACPIAAGAAVRGTIPYPYDRDGYRFDVAARSRVRLELTDLPEDYDLGLYNAQGGYVASSGRFLLAPELIEVTLEPGVYYALVRSRDALCSESPYTLLLSLAPA